MGARLSMLIYSDGDAAEHLKVNNILDRSATDKLVDTLFPKVKAVPIRDGNLFDTYRTTKEIFAGCFGAISIISAREFEIEKPSKLDRRFLRIAEDKFVYLVVMRDTADWLTLAKWERGRLVRALSVTPDSGVTEDLGEKFSFETKYWEGKHSVTDPEEEKETNYPLPFHPIDLGEEALKTLFGYQLAPHIYQVKDYIDEESINPESISLIGYKRNNPWWKVW